MTDLSDKKLESDEHQQQQTSEENEKAKKCADCGTSKTPLWRGGPAGPKSLCNACGIRSRKKVRVSSGIKTEKARAFSSTKKSSGSGSSTTTTTTSSSSGNGSGGGGSSCSTLTTSSSNDKSSRLVGSLNQRLISLGREVMMQRSTVGKRSVRKNNNNNININKLGEDEQAAVLLMALSYGSVYA